MARRFTQHRSSARVSRQKVWVAPADQAGVAVTDGASVIINSFTPDGAGLIAPTLIRVRGELLIFPVGGADLSFGGAFGMCVVSADALAAGTAAIPRPFDDADWGGWFVWQAYNGRIEFLSGGQLMMGVRFQIDSKAMRKFKPNDVLVSMCESQAGAVTCDVVTRQLFLLS